MEVPSETNRNSNRNALRNYNVQRKIFVKNLKRYVKEYCDVSSIQGLSYITRENISNFERCWWIVIFLLCVGGCSKMVYEVYDKWVDSPVLVSLATKDTPIHHIPFPAVTICPESKISRQCVNYSRVLRMKRDGQGDLVPPLENEYFDNMALLCRAENHKNSSSPKKLDDYTDFLDKCKSFDLRYSQCKFGKFKVNCEDYLQPIITDEGLCYSFNMFDVRDIYSDANRMKYLNETQRNPDWDVDRGYPNNSKQELFDYFPLRVLGSGAQNAFSVVFLTKKSEIYYSCRNFALQGMRVALHMPARIPRPSQVYFPVGLNELVVAQVTPTLMGTTPRIKNYEPEDRNCFFGRERKLKYFRIYSQSNCNLECWTNYTIQECGCVHFYMPRDSNTSICPLDRRQCIQSAAESYAISTFPKRNKSRRSEGKLTSDCNCLPICSDLNYYAETSRGKWNWNDPNSVGLNDLRDYSETHYASAVKIFFKSSYFLPTEKSELYGLTDFLSNTGGTLGLFTGFSLVSLIELIYYMSVRLIENYRQFGYWAGRRTN